MMDEDFREVTAFDVVCDFFKDDCALELYENKELPTVCNPFNPFSFSIHYEDKVWYCEARYTCLENKEQFVQINRAYTNEMVGMLMVYEENGEA